MRSAILGNVIVIVQVIGAVLVATLFASPTSAADYYVATNGSNNNPGTLAQPFLTIQQAANVAGAGDQVFIRGGIYREMVMAMHSGTSSAPISFQPYQKEQVTITGLDRFSGNWAPYSGSSYSSLVSAASQVFVNGVMMNEARWPNAGYNNLLRANYAAVDSASVNNNTAAITDAALNPATDWNNAKIAICSGVDYVTWTWPATQNLIHVL